MNCHYCGGQNTCRDTTTNYLGSTPEQLFRVDNVPVVECIQCGDQAFSTGAMRSLNRIVKGEAKAIGRLVVLEYDFNNLEAEGRPSVSTTVVAGIQTASEPVRVREHPHSLPLSGQRMKGSIRRQEEAGELVAL